MSIDWMHVASAVAGFVVGFAPTAKRIVGNLGRTEVEIADAKLASAVSAVEQAHATPDANDDAPAEQKRASAMAALEHAKRLKAIADGVAADS